MPDAKKLAVLAARGFVLRQTCLTCSHFSKWSDGAFWGYCRDIEPVHEKHSFGARVSVRADGWCPKYLPVSRHVEDIQRSGFDRFMPA